MFTRINSVKIRLKVIQNDIERSSEISSNNSQKSGLKICRYIICWVAGILPKKYPKFWSTFSKSRWISLQKMLQSRLNFIWNIIPRISGQKLNRNLFQEFAGILRKFSSNSHSNCSWIWVNMWTNSVKTRLKMVLKDPLKSGLIIIWNLDRKFSKILFAEFLESCLNNFGTLNQCCQCCLLT